MIAVQLAGGLGNQLFQYATGRALAIRRGTGLYLDTRIYARSPSRGYSLADFAIETVPLGSAVLPAEKRSLAAKILRRPPKGNDFTVFAEQRFSFDETVESLPDWSYLKGYFQSELYFQEIASSLRRELAVISPLNGQNQATLGDIKASCSISLHVRRGDYVSEPSISRRLGSCSIEYYKRAAEHIAASTGGSPTFFVFSDEIDWAKANLRLPFQTEFIGHNGPDRAHEDLRLMAACQHHVLANSSFSWWGAWLNPSTQKQVIAPSRWFADRRFDESTLIPSTWVRL